MTIQLYQVDAFTDKIFSGNPAAVCPLVQWPKKRALLQEIAAENNLSETAFFVPKSPGRYELTWFTPTKEIDLCGHATLAAAHIICTELGFEGDSIVFETPSAGELTVTKPEGDLYSLNFPSRKPEKAVSPPGLLEALGGSPIAVLAARDYMVVYETDEDILDLEPNMSILKKMDKDVIVTAEGNTVDFVSRFFAPASGIEEDPATGSAHCTLIPFWAEKLEKKKMHALQISRRQGEFFCIDKGDRVEIMGQAVTYLKGEIFL